MTQQPKLLITHRRLTCSLLNECIPTQVCSGYIVSTLNTISVFKQDSSVEIAHDNKVKRLVCVW